MSVSVVSSVVCVVQESRAALPIERVNGIWEECKDMGLLLGKGGLYSSVLRFKPPMCISQQDVDFTLDVLQVALERDEAKHK